MVKKVWRTDGRTDRGTDGLNHSYSCLVAAKNTGHLYVWFVEVIVMFYNIQTLCDMKWNKDIQLVGKMGLKKLQWDFQYHFSFLIMKNYTTSCIESQENALEWVLKSVLEA